MSSLLDSLTIDYFLVSLLLRLVYITAISSSSSLNISVDITSNRAYALRSLLSTFLRGSKIYY